MIFFYELKFKTLWRDIRDKEIIQKESLSLCLDSFCKLSAKQMTYIFPVDFQREHLDIQ